MNYLIIKRVKAITFFLLLLLFQNALAVHVETKEASCPLVTQGEELKRYHAAFEDIDKGNIPDIGNLEVNVIIKKNNSKYFSLLDYAAFKNKTNVVLWLLDIGAFPNGCNNSYYKYNDYNNKVQFETSAIYYAVRNNNKVVLQSLIEKGADVNIRDDMGDTLLHSMIKERESRTEFMDSLIKAGADPLAKDYDSVAAINLKKRSLSLERTFMAISLFCENKAYEHIVEDIVGYNCSEFIQKRNDLEETLKSCRQGEPYFKAPVSMKMQIACIGQFPSEKFLSMLDQKNTLWNKLFGTDDWFWEALPSAMEEIKSKPRLIFEEIRRGIDQSNVELVKLILDTTNKKPFYHDSFPPMLLASKNPAITRMLLKWGIRTNLGDRLSNDYHFNIYNFPNPLVEAVKKGHLENAKILIEFGANPDHRLIQQMGRHKMTRDMALLLQFYKRSELPSYIDDETSPQHQKNIRLKKAVMAQDVFETAASLANGANPNTRLPDGHGNSNGDLLAEALILEQDQAEASISRLLLLYGAATGYIARNNEDKKLSIRKYERINALLWIIHGDGTAKKPAFSWSQYIQDHELAVALDYFNPFTREKNETAAEGVFNMFQRTAAYAGVRMDEHPDELSGLTACLNLKPAVTGLNQVWADGNSTPPFTTPRLNGTVCFEDNCEAVESHPESHDDYYETQQLPYYGVETFQPYCQMIDSLMSPAGKEVLRR